MRLNQDSDSRPDVLHALVQLRFSSLTGRSHSFFAALHCFDPSLNAALHLDLHKAFSLAWTLLDSDPDFPRLEELDLNIDASCL